jgi:Tol biopolymer transport system component
VVGVSWSPDGKRVAYDSGTGKGESEIAVIGVDGSGRRTLTKEGEPFEPAWSPDGTSIAFFKWIPKVGDAIAVINVDGTGLRVITTPGPCNDQFGTWSPDGTKILFYRQCKSQDGAPGIYTVGASGSDERQLIATASQDAIQRGETLRNGIGVVFGLDWSPDGSRIVLGNLPPGSGSDPVEVINADGSGLRMLTEGESPTWSPDGDDIAFLREGALFEMSASGQRIHEIEGTAGLNLTGVSWGP